MLGILVLAAVLVLIPVLLLGVFGPPASSGGHGHQRGPAARWFGAQFNLWQICVAVLVAGLIFAILTAGPRGPGFALFLAALLVLGLFLHAWRSEFVFLMGLRDDEFPGQYDKLIWVFVLLAMAPVGLWLFRSYRLAHWPEPEMAESKPVADLF
jgi:hypothetical protein